MSARRSGSCPAGSTPAVTMATAACDDGPAPRVHLVMDEGGVVGSGVFERVDAPDLDVAPPDYDDRRGERRAKMPNAPCASSFMASFARSPVHAGDHVVRDVDLLGGVEKPATGDLPHRLLLRRIRRQPARSSRRPPPCRSPFASASSRMAMLDLLVEPAQRFGLLGVELAHGEIEVRLQLEPKLARFPVRSPGTWWSPADTDRDPDEAARSCRAPSARAASSLLGEQR